MARIEPRTAGLSLLALACFGCESGAVLLNEESPRACQQVLPLEQALDAVVSLRVSNARPGQSLTCSGVAIAQDLVLTALHCVMQPGALAPLCDPSAGWQPVETGDGSSRYGEPYPLDSLSVYIGAQPPAIDRGFARVRQIIPSSATSRCADDFALLALDCPLPVTPVPVRLDPRATRVGERLIVSGFGGQNFTSPRRELDGQVLLVAPDEGDVRAPPRSLLLSAPACSFDQGGPVFSGESGALVGNVVTGTGMGCADAAGNALVTHLAPFAELLLEAAASVGATLRVEPSSMFRYAAQACDPLLSAAAVPDAGVACASR